MKRTRFSSPSLFLLPLLLHCAARPTTNTTPQNTSTADASTAPDAPAPGPLVTSFPPDLFLRAAAEGARLETLVLALLQSMPAEARTETLSSLGIPAGTALENGAFARAVGLDSQRELRAGMWGLDERTRSIAARLRTLGVDDRVQPVPPNHFDQTRAALSGAPIALGLRVLVPITDPAPAQQLIGRFATQLGLVSSPALPGYARMYLPRTFASIAVAVAETSDTLVIDLYLEPIPPAARTENEDRAVFQARARAALTALRARDASAPSGEALAAEQAVVRFSTTPSQLGLFNFMLGVGAVLSAASSPSVEVSMRSAVSARGLYEASRSLVLAENDQGPYFRSYDLRIEHAQGGGPSGLGLTLRAEQGPAIPELTAQDWEAQTSIADPRAVLSVDASVRWLAAIPYPAVPRGGADLEPFRRALMEAGLLGTYVAAPQALVLSMRSALDSPAMPELLRNALRNPANSPFVRVGIYNIGRGTDVTWGLLPDNTPDARAFCVLSTRQENCPPTERLTLNRAAERGGSFVRLLRVGRRFVLLQSGQRAAVETAALREISSANPVRYELSRAVLASGGGTGPETALGPMMGERTLFEVVREGSAWVLRARPVAQ